MRRKEESVKYDYSLYVLTDEKLMTTDTVEESVRLALEGGATMIQLREKTLDYNSFLKRAEAIKKITDAYDVPLIINDNVWIAKEVDAAGVHLGNEDMSLEEARSILGSDKIIGVSAHNLEEALNAQKAGVDYLGLGAMVATSTKKEAKVMDFDILVSILNRIEIPCVIIGGISEENLSRWNGLKLSGIAVISAVIGQEDIKEAANRMGHRFIHSPKISGVIFDLDGTLLDSNYLWRFIDQMFLGKRGLQANREYIQKMSGIGFYQGAVYTKEIFGLPESVEDILKEYFSMALYEYSEKINLKVGAIEVLKFLKEKKIPMAVATMNEERLFMPCLKRLGILDYFDTIFSSNQVNTNKDHPEIYLKAARALGTLPKETAVLEDISVAANTARKAGFLSVGVFDKNGAQKKEELMSVSDIYLENLLEIFPRIQQIATVDK